MSIAIENDDEILQDFLVEATEIVEQLNEQLVDLEQMPEDNDLLNAIFRGFHTVKGGAGFLSIESLVEVCHRAEDVFNVLRQGQRKVTSELMDPVLEALDLVNAIMEQLRNGAAPEAANPDLLARLEHFAAAPDAAAELEPESVPEQPPETLAAEEAAAAQETQTAAQAETDSSTSEEEITEDEFEALLDQLHGSSADPAVADPLDPEPEHEAMTEQQGAPQAAPEVPDNPVGKRDAAPTKAGETVRTASADTSVRVDTQRLDDIMNMVGELVLVRNRLSTLKASIADEALADVVGNLDVVTSDLQLAVMKTRMQPMRKVFGRFPRVVRDLARNLGKEVDLEMRGEDTDLDKNLVEALSDPLIHLVRNAIDHGIEPPDEREAMGKPRRGRVVLSATQEGDHILLLIEDDGRGMDADKLRRKAVERGLLDEESAARLDDKDCFNLIFHAGFSTRDAISDVSGRGVGMDVVKTGIARINGTVDIDSDAGKGSRILIKLPLTLAILPTLMVVLGNQPFALPLANVVEIFNLDLSRTNTVDGQLTIRVRERALPLFYLGQWLVNGARETPDENTGHVVVVNIGGAQVGLVVDMLVGQEEVVIKPLGAFLHGQEGMAGATITSDGKIALILDMPGLMRRYARRY